MSIPRDINKEIVKLLFTDIKTKDDLLSAIKTISIVNKEYNSILKDPNFWEYLSGNIIAKEFRYPIEWIRDPKMRFVESFIYQKNMEPIHKLYLREWNKPNVTIISFSNKGLMQVPILLLEKHRETLHTVDLSWNNIKTIPKEISLLKNLKALILVGNELHTLPEAIMKLKNLRDLFISNNKFKTLPPLPPHIIALYINENKINIESIPEYLYPIIKDIDFLDEEEEEDEDDIGIFHLKNKQKEEEEENSEYTSESEEENSEYTSESE